MESLSLSLSYSAVKLDQFRDYTFCIIEHFHYEASRFKIKWAERNIFRDFLGYFFFLFSEYTLATFYIDYSTHFSFFYL